MTGTTTVTVGATPAPTCHVDSLSVFPSGTQITRSSAARLSVSANGTGPFVDAWYEARFIGLGDAIIVRPAVTTQYLAWAWGSVRPQYGPHLATRDGEGPFWKLTDDHSRTFGSNDCGRCADDADGANGGRSTFRPVVSSCTGRIRSDRNGTLDHPYPIDESDILCMDHE
jgi:hypothetical protein